MSLINIRIVCEQIYALLQYLMVLPLWYEKLAGVFMVQTCFHTREATPGAAALQIWEEGENKADRSELGSNHL